MVTKIDHFEYTIWQLSFSSWTKSTLAQCHPVPYTRLQWPGVRVTFFVHGVSSLGFSTHGLCVYQAVTLPSSLRHPRLVCPECLHWLPVSCCCFPLRLELCPRLQRTLVWLDGLVSEAGHLPVSPATHCWMCLEEKSWERVPWFITGFPKLNTSSSTERLIVIWPMDVRVF